MCQKRILDTSPSTLASAPFIPNRPLDCYAQTYLLFVICLSVYQLQWNPIAPSKRKDNLFKNISSYHHNANGRFGIISP